MRLDLGKLQVFSQLSYENIFVSLIDEKAWLKSLLIYRARIKDYLMSKTVLWKALNPVSAAGWR
jgi:hypothetical protein